MAGAPLAVIMHALASARCRSGGWRSRHCASTSTGIETTRPSIGCTMPSHSSWKRSSWVLTRAPPSRAASPMTPGSSSRSMVRRHTRERNRVRGSQREKIASPGWGDVSLGCPARRC
jgi:hypothetical protein